MKKLTTLFLALFLSAFQFANAQEYHPLLEKGKSWDDESCYMGCMCADWAKRFFYSGDDTLVDGLLCSKIYSYDFHAVIGQPFCPPYFVDTVQNSGFTLLHEDTLERKVYMLSNFYDVPELLYDFSLQIGDTFVSDWVTAGSSMIVEDIDQITLHNGEPRKRWCFPWWDGERYWEMYYIEGIGMGTGFLGDMVQFEWWSSLMCVQKDGVQLWGGACYGLVGEDEISTNDLQIYPNPAADFIHISTPQNFDRAGVKIFNSLGQLVLVDEIRSGNTVINVSGFERGMYFVLIESENEVLKEKLVVR